MQPDEIFTAYEHHVSAVDAEFGRVYQQFAERMQCRRGCSMCCSQMFSISRIEAEYISRAMKAMPEWERDRLQTAARQYVADARELLGKDEDPDGDEAITPRPGLRLACPALAGDACSIYEARPIICRKWGIPIFNPAKPAELQACELNFKPGEEVDIEGLIEPQVALLEEWVELKGLAKRSPGFPQTRSTVAEAILGEALVGLREGSTGKSDVK
jgi:Fe-S-cluster containining protein